MLRTIGWTLFVLRGLLLVAALSLETTVPGGVLGTLQERVLDHTDAGLGFDDGRLVWRETEPVRITVEQLPTLEGRRLGTNWSSAFVFARMSWFGVSLRETVAHCLRLPPARVLGDESLDTIWLDVDAARPQGPFDSVTENWDPVRARILEGLQQQYGLQVTVGIEPLSVRIVRPGPGWAAHLVEGRRNVRSSRGDGHLRVNRMKVSALLDHMRGLLGIAAGEGFDEDARCDVDLTWDPGDPQALSRALAEQLDLHVEQVTRELEVARVAGVATPPAHLR